MTLSRPTRDLSDRHEKYLAQMLGMRQSKGSGNQWRDPMDARHDALETRFAFAVDGKASLAKSISVPRSMWEKAVEQAGGSHRPMLALRYYQDEGLRDREALDLVVLSLDDFAEMLQELNERWVEI